MRISLPALPFLKPASIPFLPLLGLKMRKHSMGKRHVLPALQRFKPSWLHLNKRCGSQARFQACRDTAFETKRLPTASAHEFACCISHRFLIFDANDCIENCVTRGLVRNSHSTWCWQEKESNSKHRSLAPRFYRISISQTLKTRGLGRLQNLEDSLVPTVDTLGLWKNIEQLRRNSKVSRPRTPVSWAIAMQQIQGAKLPATKERLPNVQSGQSDNFSTKMLRIQAAPAACRLFCRHRPKNLTQRRKHNCHSINKTILPGGTFEVSNQDAHSETDKNAV